MLLSRRMNENNNYTTIKKQEKEMRSGVDLCTTQIVIIIILLGWYIYNL